MTENLYTIALEEHFAIPGILARTTDAPGPVSPAGASTINPVLLDLGAERLAAMDAVGVDLQVLSHTAPGLEYVLGADAVALAREANDVALDAVARHPDRFAAFATLPVSDPGAAAVEFRRAVGLGMCGALVNGSVDGRFLDHPSFEDLLAAVEESGLPLYLHPGVPPAAVIDAYYSGFSDKVTRMLSNSGWGWHADTAVHVLRLVLAGVFDRHPGLQVIVGHMGEMLPVMLDRITGLLSPVSGLPRTVAEYLTDHVSLTISGVYSPPAFQAAVAAFGMDRVMFSIDYPYGPGAPARRFLDSVSLAPADRRRLAGGNAARILGLTIPGTPGATRGPA